jgi:2-methylcitrate dehydratase PrpD
MTLQENIASFVNNVNYEDLPESVVEQTKYCILDYLGCALVGSQTTLAEKFYYQGKRFGSNQASIMIGDGGLVSPIWAAMVNGTIGHIHEFDDSCPGGGHTGTVIIPAALAAGNMEKINGMEFISSVVLGYETACRLGSAVGSSHRNRGYHSTSTFSTFGASVAAGKAFKLNDFQLSKALGIASISATGILEVHKGKSILKPIQVGKSSANGVTAALMAMADIPTSLTILEDNFYNSFTDGDYDLDKICKDFLADFAILKTYFKPYPACGHTHKAIKAAILLMKKNNIVASDMNEILVQSYTYAAKHMGGKDRYKPQTITEAKFSIPYLIALIVDHKEINIDDFTDTKISDNQIKKIMKKIRVFGDSKFDKTKKRPQEVIFKLKNGEVYSKYIENTKISYKEIERKYESLAKRALPKKDVYSLKKTVFNLENIRDINELNSFLVTDRFSLPLLQ